MILEALRNSVVLKLQPKKTQKNGIRLSDRAAEESDFAEVVSVGPDVNCLHIGDVVLRPAPANYEYISEEGDDRGTIYLISPETDIAARVPDGC